MKKKVFFAVGLLASAIAASFFIPLQNGEYWWSASTNAPEVVIVDGDRIPAGGPQDGQYYAPEEDTTYQEPPPVEETPVYSGGKDAKPEPTPAPVYEAPQPTKINCIRAALTEPSLRPPGQKFGSKNWIRNLNLSDAYINSFLRAAGKNGRVGSQGLRAAITSIVAAGYCSGKNYKAASPLGIPVVHGKPYEASIDERAQAYRADPRTKYLICTKKADLMEHSRKDICEKMYQVCGIRQYSNHDCRMADDRNSRDDDDHQPNTNGGNNTGGSTGEHEVGNGSNEGSGHGANSDGGQGEGPPGASR